MYLSKIGQNPQPIYFYCSRDTAEPDRSDPDAVLASLLRQLTTAQSDRPLPCSLVEKYKNEGESFRSKGLHLEESRNFIIEMVNLYDVTTIILDTLDECDPERRQLLLDAFEDILRESTGLVKIFISSRKDQDIVDLLRDYPNLAISLDKNSKDIETFVRTETEKLVLKRRILSYSQAKEEMQEVIIDHVIERAGGMSDTPSMLYLHPLLKFDRFRWASLQLEVLCTLTLDKDIRSNLGRLPPKLEQLYLEIYETLNSYPGETGRSIIENTLKWLLSAQSTLSVSQFLWAIAVPLKLPLEDISKQLVLKLCHNLVVYDEGLDVFRFAHLSVREFLEKRSEFSELSCNILAAQSCLLHMIASAGPPGVATALRYSHVRDLREIMLLSGSSTSAEFLAYANSYWMKHCQSASQNAWCGATDLGQLLQHFLHGDSLHSPAINAWVRWFCNSLMRHEEIDEFDPDETPWQLQGLLCRYPDQDSEILCIAAAYGFCETVEVCLQSGKLSVEAKTKALSLAIVSGGFEVFDSLMARREHFDLTVPIVTDAAKKLDKERLAALIGTNFDLYLLGLVISSCFERLDDGRITMLLEMYPGFTVTEDMLKHAVHRYENLNLETFRLLLTRSYEVDLTESLPKIAFKYELEVFLLILDRLDIQDFPEIQDWFANTDGATMKFLVENGGITKMTEKLMIRAACWGDGELLKLMIRRGGQITQNVFIQSACTVNVEVLDVLLQQGCQINGQLLLTAFREKRYNNKGLELLLEYADETVIFQEYVGLLRALASSRYSRTSTMRKLLDMGDETVIAQVIGDLLLCVANNRSPHFREIFILLLHRANDIAITEELYLATAGYPGLMGMLLYPGDTTGITVSVAIKAVRTVDLQNSSRLLACIDMLSIANDLLKAAAANCICGDDLVRMLLREANLTDFPETIFLEAMENYSRGKEVLLVLEEAFGPIAMSEDRLCLLLRGRSLCQNILRWIEPAVITNKVLVATIRRRLSPETDNLQHAVLENSLHLPVTSEILEAAAQGGHLDIFKFFWNRSCMAKVPERLLVKVTESATAYLMLKFPLDEAEDIHHGEGFAIAIVSSYDSSEGNLLKSLLDRRIAMTITPRVVKAALAMGYRVPKTVQLLLKHCTTLEITEEIFQIAATTGNQGALNILAEHCELDSPPQKWLDVANIHKAARDGDIDTLKDLLDADMKPETTGREGLTSPALVFGFPPKASAVQMLLAAGTAPETVRWGLSPLQQCTRQGDLDAVKILVEAGASVDFIDEKGDTPETIAKRYGRFKVCDFLEQCRIATEAEER